MWQRVHERRVSLLWRCSSQFDTLCCYSRPCHLRCIFMSHVACCNSCVQFCKEQRGLIRCQKSWIRKKLVRWNDTSKIQEADVIIYTVSRYWMEMINYGSILSVSAGIHYRIIYAIMDGVRNLTSVLQRECMLLRAPQKSVVQLWISRHEEMGPFLDVQIMDHLKFLLDSRFNSPLHMESINQCLDAQLQRSKSIPARVPKHWFRWFSRKSRRNWKWKRTGSWYGTVDSSIGSSVWFIRWPFSTHERKWEDITANRISSKFVLECNCTTIVRFWKWRKSLWHRSMWDNYSLDIIQD